MFDSGVIHTQLLKLKRVQLTPPELLLIQELADKATVLEAPVPAGTKHTLFGPVVNECLGRNRVALAHLCSLQEFALIGAALECLLFKRSVSWVTCTRDETKYLLDGCPEVRYLEDQETRGQRLLLCHPEEKSHFFTGSRTSTG